MGWDSSSAWQTKKDVVNSLVNSMLKSEWKIHAKKSTREGFWAVVENTSGAKFIYFALIQKSRGEFAAKTMSEHMGPSYYSCPVEFFDIADKPAESEKYAIEWREKVREVHSRKTRKLEIGVKFKLYGNNYTVVSPLGRTFRVVNKDGKFFRLTMKQLHQWEELTPLEKALEE